MHTPGPWRVAEPGEVDEHYAVLDGFGHTASVYGYPEEAAAALANARLIAAAPDLLQCLRECVTWLEEYYDAVSLDDDESQHLDAARAAIAKAEGTDEQDRRVDR